MPQGKGNVYQVMKSNKLLQTQAVALQSTVVTSFYTFSSCIFVKVRLLGSARGACSFPLVIFKTLWGGNQFCLTLLKAELPTHSAAVLHVLFHGSRCTTMSIFGACPQQMPRPGGGDFLCLLHIQATDRYINRYMG